MKAKYIRKPNAIFYVEETDLFGGEFNYSWCKRSLVIASTARGAARKTVDARVRRDCFYSENESTFKSPSGLTGCYVLKVSEEEARELLKQNIGVEIIDDSLFDKLNKEG